MNHRLVRVLLLGSLLAVGLLAAVQVTRANGSLPEWIYVSTKAAGQTEDGVVYGREDVLELDVLNQSYSLYFDGSEHGLDSRRHNINAFSVYEEDTETMFMSFSTQNGTGVPGIDGKVYPNDIVGHEPEVARQSEEFFLVIDGSDIGLNTASEAIDGMSYISFDWIYYDGPYSYFNHDCTAGHMWLISTKGPYVVPAADGGWLKGSGSDALLFCPTQEGETTEGYWYPGFDSFRSGVTPRNAIDSLAIEEIEDYGDHLHIDFSFMVKRPFSAPGISGNPSEYLFAEYGGADYEGAYFYNDGDLNSMFPRLNGTVDALDFWYD